MKRKLLATAVAATVLFFSSSSTFAQYMIDNSVDNTIDCCDLTGGTGTFAGQPVGNYTDRGGIDYKVDVAPEGAELGKWTSTWGGAGVGAVVGYFAGSVVGTIVGAFLGYWGPMITGELANQIKNPGEAYNVESPEQRVRREAFQKMLEGFIGNMKWDDDVTLLNTGFQRTMQSRVVNMYDFKDLARRSRVGGYPTADERAILNSGYMVHSVVRKAAGIFLNTSGTVTSSHSATPVMTLMDRAIVNIQNKLTPATDQCIAFGLVLQGTTASNRGNMISMIAGTYNTNDPERQRVNTAVIACLKKYRDTYNTAYNIIY